MPRARSTQKQPLSKTLKVLQIIATVIITLAISAVVYVLFNLDKYTVQGQMERYLEERYDKDFVVVGIPQRKASGFAVEGYLEAKAYPADDPTLEFEVRKSSKSIWDTYDNEYWSRQETERIKPVLNKVFGVIPEYEVEIGAGMIKEPMHAPLPDVDDLLAQYGKTVGYTLTIHHHANGRTNNQYYVKALARHLYKRGLRATLIYYYQSDKGEKRRIIIGDNSIEGVALGSIDISRFDEKSHK